MNPDYKDKVATQIACNYTRLEDRIISDIVRRIKKTGEITSTADYQINRLIAQGYSTDAIEGAIKEALDASYPEMFELYDKVANWEYVRNEKVYEQINQQFIPYEENEQMQKFVEAIKLQTKEELQNITQSIGFYTTVNGKKELLSPGKTYQHFLDQAIMDIATGSFDYGSVLRRTVVSLANSGLRTIDYESGATARIDVAARRAVLTGISQITQEITDENAKKLGATHFEVAWHSGARPTHQAWQGKVYTKEELVSVCGLGTVTGLCEANCYHEYYPFFPGISERNWTDEELRKMNEYENTPKSFKGKEYTLYEAKQKQRSMETAMRAQRQKVRNMQEGGGYPEEILLMRAKYQNQLNEYALFSKHMGLKQERARIYLDMKGRVAPRRGEVQNVHTKKRGKEKVNINSELELQYRTRYNKSVKNIYRNGEETVTKKIKGSKNVFIAEDSILTKFDSSNACKAVEEAYKLIYGNNIEHKPDIYILSSSSFVGKTTGAYRWYDNSLFLNEVIFKKENLKNFTDEYVFSEDARSHIIHELIHVQQHEETMKIFNRDVKTAKDFEEYASLKESLSRNKVENLIEKGYTYKVSRYAEESFRDEVYTEVMAEMYTYISLKRRTL